MLKKCPKSSWQHLNFSVMFTTENEIIRSSWRQIYRLLEYLSWIFDKHITLSEKKPPLSMQYLIRRIFITGILSRFPFIFFRNLGFLIWGIRIARITSWFFRRRSPPLWRRRVPTYNPPIGLFAAFAALPTVAAFPAFTAITAFTTAGRFFWTMWRTVRVTETK